MPASPRAQQIGATPGKPHGEAGAFLSPEMLEKVAVPAGSKELDQAITDIKDGKKAILIVSPALMRDNLDKLKQAGFGGEKSAFFADEAQDFETGSGEGAGSGMAKAAREMAKSEYAVSGSGSLIDNDSSEFHSAYSMIHPGELGDQKEFSKRFRRLADSGSGAFSDYQKQALQDQLSGGMLSYTPEVK